jgi:hypothetical protein
MILVVFILFAYSTVWRVGSRIQSVSEHIYKLLAPQTVPQYEASYPKTQQKSHGLWSASRFNYAVFNNNKYV